MVQYPAQRGFFVSRWQLQARGLQLGQFRINRDLKQAPQARRGLRFFGYT